MNALIFVLTLLATFWLISLVWSQQVAKRVFQWVIYIGLIIAVLVGVYVAYQGYRWGNLLHQLNERSLNTTELINPPPATPALNSN